MKNIRLARFLPALAILVALEAHSLSAATHVWKGPATGGLWSTASNWTNGVPTSNEASGTFLQFGAGINSTDNLSGLVVDEIIFTGGGNTIGGATALTFKNSVYTGVSIVNMTGNNSFAATLPVVAQALAINLTAGNLTISGNISGTAAPNVGGSGGTLFLNGTNTWDSTAAFHMYSASTVNLNSPSDYGAIPSTSINLGNGMGSSGSVVLRDLSGLNISSAADIFIASDGLFDLNSNSETIGQLDGTSPLAQVSLGSGTLTLSSMGALTANYGGTISGVGGTLVKGGSYTQALGGNSSYTGSTSVTAGTLIVNGAQPLSPVAVSGGALLLGAGTTGPLSVASGGNVSPGASNLLSAYGSPGLLHVAGALNLTSANYFCELNGVTPGTSYDRIASTGAASISGSTLNVILGYTPANGDSFVVLTSSALSGTFAGLPEGASLTVNGTPFLVHYSSTSVVLTVCSVAPTVNAPSPTTVTQTLCQ